MARVGLYKEEWWPVFEVTTESWADLQVEVPDELLARNKAACDMFADVQHELRKLWAEATGGD